MLPGLGVPNAVYVRPLLFGLDSADGPFRIHYDTPSKLALQFRERIPPRGAGCAFLSPIDYARYGAEYRIVPGVCVSSSQPTGTVRLYINAGVRNVRTMAVDLRVTSEIILAKILLLEKFRNLASDANGIQFIPMLGDVSTMLTKADAALGMDFGFEVNDAPPTFSIDLVEEWHDLTNLPYIHGMWVGREETVSTESVQRLVRASQEGATAIDLVATRLAKDRSLTYERARDYLQSYSYTLGESEETSLSEFIRYAYYHSVLPDAPDINFFDVDIPPPLPRN
jgi:predicted solute-binding protein